MPTIIRSDLFDKGLEVKESYETVKKRLLTAGDFIEVTDKVSKQTLNKSTVKQARPVLKEAKLKKIDSSVKRTPTGGVEVIVDTGRKV